MTAMKKQTQHQKPLRAMSVFTGDTVTKTGRQRSMRNRHGDAGKAQNFLKRGVCSLLASLWVCAVPEAGLFIIHP